MFRRSLYSQTQLRLLSSGRFELLRSRVISCHIRGINSDVAEFSSVYDGCRHCERNAMKRLAYHRSLVMLTFPQQSTHNMKKYMSSGHQETVKRIVIRNVVFKIVSSLPCLCSIPAEQFWTDLCFSPVLEEFSKVVWQLSCVSVFSICFCSVACFCGHCDKPSHVKFWPFSELNSSIGIWFWSEVMVAFRFPRFDNYDISFCSFANSQPNVCVTVNEYY